MWFLFGLMMGAAAVSGGPSSASAPSVPVMTSGIPAQCLLAENYDDYQACRFPSIFYQVGGSEFCHYESDVLARYKGLTDAEWNRVCYLPDRMKVEWAGLQALQASLQKRP